MFGHLAGQEVHGLLIDLHLEVPISLGDFAQVVLAPNHGCSGGECVHRTGAGNRVLKESAVGTDVSEVSDHRA